MANARRAVQQAHERLQVRVFLDYLNRRHGANFVVIEEPNPPEAIIRSGRITRWVEVATAFWNPAWARELNSYATPGESLKSVGDGPFLGMTAESAASFASVVRAKLQKDSYAQLASKYGPGYLVVAVESPWINSTEELRAGWSASNLQDRGYFRSVYLTLRARGGHVVRLWRY